MSQPNTGPDNWQAAENKIAITSSGSINSEPTTGAKNFQKQLNTLNITSEPDSQGTVIGGGQPSTTGPSHFQRLENRIAGSKSATGLGGVPKGFTLDGNKSGPNADRGWPGQAV